MRLGGLASLNGPGGVRWASWAGLREAGRPRRSARARHQAPSVPCGDYPRSNWPARLPQPRPGLTAAACVGVGNRWSLGGVVWRCRCQTPVRSAQRYPTPTYPRSCEPGRAGGAWAASWSEGSPRRGPRAPGGAPEPSDVADRAPPARPGASRTQHQAPHEQPVTRRTSNRYSAAYRYTANVLRHPGSTVTSRSSWKVARSRMRRPRSAANCSKSRSVHK